MPALQEILGYFLNWKSLNYIGFAEKVVREGRELLTGNREQFQPSGYPQFSKSDPGKCTNFETPFAKTLHFLVIKISETLINKRVQFYSASPIYIQFAYKMFRI